MYATVDLDQPIREVVESASNAEDLFEEAGIDYWFGWERSLRSACEAARVDPETIVFRLIARDEKVKDLSRLSLVSLFSMLDQHFKLRLEPVLLRTRRAAETLDDLGAKQCAAAVIDIIERIVSSHVQTVRRTFSPLVAAIDAGVSTTIDPQLLRQISLEHATLSARADDLRAQALEDSEFALAARELVREIHHHIKIAYNFIHPRLVSLLRAKDF
jgi:iron-sulfur cluster repair protein YtfE (RIC family)